MHFLIILAFVWFIVIPRVAGRRRRRAWAHGPWQGPRRPLPPRAPFPAPRGGSAPAAKALPPRDPVAELQREWVEGRLSDEQYEAGLDEVFAARTRARRDAE